MASSATEPTERSIFNNSPTSPSLVYVVGAPGAGKGTLCTLLAKTYNNVHHLSVGDHMRSLQDLNNNQITSETFGGMERADFNARMEKQELIPAESVVKITHNALMEIVESTSGNSEKEKQIILVDGFPRSLETAKLADSALGRPAKVLFFNCPRDLAEERFLQRKRSVNDGVEVFRRRHGKFKDLNPVILQSYVDCVVEIGTEKGTEETWAALMKDVGKLFGGMVLVKNESVGGKL
ncbi:hypothetical protein Q7P37_004133 [Cladosporium fusiforme]